MFLCIQLRNLSPIEVNALIVWEFITLSLETLRSSFIMLLYFENYIRDLENELITNLPYQHIIVYLGYYVNGISTLLKNKANGINVRVMIQFSYQN